MRIKCAVEVEMCMIAQKKHNKFLIFLTSKNQKTCILGPFLVLWAIVPTIVYTDTFLVWSVSDQTHELVMEAAARICSLGNISANVKGAHKYEGSKEPQ